MAEPVVLGRRERRRLETIEEVLDVAVDVMTEQGVAGLSIGEVARRMGIRPPSLYVYFDSKNALYDAVFARGAAAATRVAAAAYEDIAPDVTDARDALLPVGEAFVKWAVEHPAYSHLLFWRPVPGYEPSPEAYAASVDLMTLTTEFFDGLRRQRLLRTDVPLEQVVRDWTIVISGVISQQLSNAPDESFHTGRFTTALPAVVAMFVGCYGVAPAHPRKRKPRANHR
jgi:AcrR family transcriptional regulator